MASQAIMSVKRGPGQEAKLVQAFYPFKSALAFFLLDPPSMVH